jgi:anaerobic magnesium-protoporphyrin IX monomethyl ester cyclase
MDILLVNPPAGFSYGILGIMRPPLGLAYIASVLRGDHHVRIVDFGVEREDWNRYPYSEFDIVGISADTTRALTALKIAGIAKNQGATVVMGGPHASFMDEEALESGAVDYVVRNEGEYSMLSLVRYLSGDVPFEEVRGVSCIADGKVYRTPDIAFIRDLDSLPFPARNLLSLSAYREKMNGRPMTTLVTSRGCPFDCEFCSASQFSGIAWRARSVENILEEVGLLHEEYGYTAVSFVDDNFTLKPGRAIDLSERIIARGWDIIWAAMTRVDTIVKRPDMVRAMARAGFRWTFIGFESGTQEALDGYGKQATLGDGLKAMEILEENDVAVTGAFILGAPSETKEMMRQTIDFAKRLNPRRAQFSLLTPYPGTRLYENVKDRLLHKNWGLYSGLHPTIDLDHVTPEELRKIQIEAYLSFYGRPGKAVENMSYIWRVFPRVSKHWASLILSDKAGSVLRSLGSAKDRAAGITKLLS